MCVCVCVCVLTLCWHANNTHHHCFPPSYPLLPIQLVGLVLIACGIYMCVVAQTPGLTDLDLAMIIIEALLFFAGGILAISFSVFGLVIAYTQSRIMLITVSCLHE